MYTFRTGTGPGYRHMNLACARAVKLSRCHLFYCQWNFGFVTDMVFMTLRWRGMEMHSARHFSVVLYHVIRRRNYG